MGDAAPRPQTDSDERIRRFESLIVPEVDFLARVARSMSRSSAEAEDLAQEALLKAYRALDRFDGRYPRAWLYRIARNTAINRDQRNRELLLDDGDDIAGGSLTPADELDGPEGRVMAPILDHVLEQALDELPPAFRLVIQLVDVEGMRYQEAADVLDVPLGTVMSRLHRARKRLRRSLAGTHLDRVAGAGSNDEREEPRDPGGDPGYGESEVGEP